MEGNLMLDQLDLFAAQAEQQEWPEQQQDQALWKELKGMTMAEQNAKAAMGRDLSTYGHQRATKSRLPAWTAPNAPNDGAAVDAGATWSAKDHKRNMHTPGLEPPLRSGIPWSRTITKAEGMAAQYRNDLYVEELTHLRKHGVPWIT